ncbi:MAG: hypothetical protein K2O29_01340 [Ruminococcus sp.]|nr:hypothetical protein [Ruminococcus sp.]MDE6847795.1 hypothetical protein [Ruminococcus sp.]MDE7137091.1 hypothetical protein [Ruminococcus sp.]
MTTKTEQKLTPYERAGMYTVLSKTETDTHYIETIRTYDGATVINRIPKHTREEQSAIDKSILRALVKSVNPDVDFSKVEYMELIL